MASVTPRPRGRTASAPLKASLGSDLLNGGGSPGRPRVPAITDTSDAYLSLPTSPLRPDCNLTSCMGHRHPAWWKNKNKATLRHDRDANPALCTAGVVPCEAASPGPAPDASYVGCRPRSDGRGVSKTAAAEKTQV
ncbi:unnamed protein product [Gadus morhua 'NCC']